MNDPVTESTAASTGFVPRALGTIERVVLKVGSAVLAHEGHFHAHVFEQLAADVAALRERKIQVVMVVSGAVAAGYHALKCRALPTEVVERQAAASVGQHRMMAVLDKAFARHTISIAQLLLSADDIEHRRRFLSARHTLNMLLDRGVVPIINENDALSDDEIKVGDNDHLAALVTNVVSANLMIMLSRVRGLYAAGTTDTVVQTVEIGSEVDRHIKAGQSASGVGGMAAKVSAARLASSFGVPTIIADGREAGLLARIVRGEPVGTLFMPRQRDLSLRKKWIAVRTRSLGTIRVDEGAERAIRERGASLLPSGIVEVHGTFAMGSRVDIADASGRVFAVGLVSYPAHDVRRLIGRRRSEIREILGYAYVEEIVHRDDLVLVGED